MLHGSINHVSLTVSDLPEAMTFFAPLLEFEVVHMPLAEERAKGLGHAKGEPR